MTVPRPTRFEALALVALSAWLAVPAVALRSWWVEDAAIAFAYARNLAAGDGLVPFPGGERAEGFSDPAWVALLAAFSWLGLDPFVVSKWLGALLAAACVPVAWAIAARITRRAALPAALLVATSATHGIWASAGLENPLASLFLALGIWALLAERGRFPWSALCFLGLALTRPEGPVYAAVGLVAVVVRDRDWRRALGWLAAFALPLAAFEAARLAYFALPLPLPYYAKLGTTSAASMVRWSGRGWRYLRGFGANLGWLWVLPILAAALAGVRGWRAVAGLVAVGVVWLAVWLPDGGLVDGRTALVTVAFLGVPWLALGRPEAGSRLLLAALAGLPLAFALRANGDWMAGYRWMALGVVPASVLLALGIDALRERAGRAALVVLAVPLAFNLVFLWSYARRPEPMTPRSTLGRVKEFNRVADLVHLDRPWLAVDHAMGGMAWWGPPRGEAIDLYGLTSVPVALHRMNHNFVRQFYLDPPEFDFVHLKGGFRDPRFAAAAIPMPRRPGRNADNWMRRDLVLADAWPFEPLAVAFSDGHRLEGVRVGAREVSRAAGFYVELGLSRGEGDGPFTVRLTLDGPATATVVIEPGYDGLAPPSTWRPGEVFVARHALVVPASLPDGDYDLVVTIAGAEGEARLPGALRLVPDADALERAEDDVATSRSEAAAGRCGDAEASRRRSLDRRPLDRTWRSRLDDLAAPLATCWARAAEAESDPIAALASIRRSRRWDPRSADALAAGAHLADRLWPEAEAARSAGDIERAFRLYDAVVTADPRRSWARRYAEEARGRLLSPGQ